MLRKLKSFIKDAAASIFFSMVPRFKRGIDPTGLGINFVGFARAEMGLGEAMRSLVSAASAAHVPLLVRDFDPVIQSQQNNQSMGQHLQSGCRFPINCLCINPDVLYRLPQWLRYEEWGRRYNIGYWFWELPNFPKNWRYATKIVDEVWVNTEYVASAMRQGCDHVEKIPFAVEFDFPADALDRSYFGLNKNAFLFLFSYDFLSSSGRKNPEAVVDAFVKAFPEKADDTVGLVIKSVNGELAQAQLTALAEKFHIDPRVTILDKQLSTEEMRALINCADCYVSLHRAEGLGLGMAEAMYLGKPVIATAYSGNMEFMNHDNSCLVPYELIPVNPEAYPNAEGQVWADPDVEAAALEMRKVFEQPAFAASIGKNAAAYMREHHSLSVAGKAVSDRLQEIQKNSEGAGKMERIPKSMLMLGQRGLQALVSLVTMMFIARFLSSESQGWYYAFLSLASLYTLADLGLSVALVPYFARSFATTALNDRGALCGPEAQLLKGRLSQSFNWYLVLACLYILVLLPFGLWFFSRLPEAEREVTWVFPWCAIVFACAGQLLLMPLMAFIEAAGKVVQITLMRLFQIAAGGAVCWVVLYQGNGLWASFIVAASSVLVPLLWLGVRWPALLGLLKDNFAFKLSFNAPIAGVQWRIAISWICAYLSSQIYSPLLMQIDGAKVSGELALSMAIANMVGVLALSSMAGKVAFVGHDAARNDLPRFKEKFNADLLFFSVMYGLGALSVGFAYWFIEDRVYATRVLPFWQIAALLVFMFVVNLMTLFSTYLRSYLREPFMRVNLIGTLLTLPLATIGAWYYSSAGIVTVLAGVALLVTLPFALTVWRGELAQLPSKG